ncbi:PREDICTED: baculoviral IAP repeat-containing protein 5.1-like [Nanorana parkeri]|uniref:baculoviral IAP repeat-containing protein 5.1-like n=1 Tax=Nanorana parkeri TaxID=125878 RepID=UPI000854FEB9|nr:PREDICTED: baculoviral IAP repeat-containing protein 5.1-like [Nanorana parkeri]
MHVANNKFSETLQRLQTFKTMYDYNARLKTFADWPFTENCKCTPENMAKAGFIHCPTENEPDVACCFFCLKELEGWEPDDDPRVEHSKRSTTCGFLSLTKSTDELTMEELLRLEVSRIKIFYRKFASVVTQYLDEEMTATTRRLVEYFANQHNCSLEMDLQL